MTTQTHPDSAVPGHLACEKCDLLREADRIMAGRTMGQLSPDEQREVVCLLAPLLNAPTPSEASHD